MSPIIKVTKDTIHVPRVITETAGEAGTAAGAPISDRQLRAIGRLSAGAIYPAAATRGLARGSCLHALYRAAHPFRAVNLFEAHYFVLIVICRLMHTGASDPETAWQSTLRR
jgi:hypothetical protein